jgi:hypothetical protein
MQTRVAILLARDLMPTRAVIDGVTPVESNGDRPEDLEREQRLAEHVDAATDAIEKARQSVEEIRRLLRFPLSPSTRLEGDRDA